MWKRRLGLWLAFLILYAATTSGDILPADSGEFQLTAARWGIAHPPGYPLYTLTSALWMRLIAPLGTPYYRVNLLSAALAATTLLLTFEAVHTWARAWGYPRRAAHIGGLTAALLLGGAATFWAQATIANIRMPAALFTAWGFLTLARRARPHPPTEAPDLIPLALILGLGVGHHPSLIFTASGWGLYLLLRDPTLPIHPRRWWRAALVGLGAWAVPQLYLILRGSDPTAPLSPGDLHTWHGFWHHVLARGFGGDMFAYATPADLALRLPLLPTLFRLQFPTPYLIAALLAEAWLIRRHPRLGLTFLTSWSVHTFVTITYRAPQTVEYLMPAYLPVVLTLGLGTAALVTRLPPAAPLILLPLLLRLPHAAPDFVALANDPAVRARTAPLLEAAPPHALLLADWRWATPLWLLQQVDGLRPDVEVAYVYPTSDDYEADWRRRAEAAGTRPVLTTHAYAWEGWTFAPVGGGFRLYPRPLREHPALPGYLPLEGGELGPVRLLAYRWWRDGRRSPWEPGQTVELTLAWTATGPQQPPPSLTVRLWDANGHLLAQADRFLGGDTAPGETRYTRFTLALPPDRCDGTAAPTVGLYTVEGGQFHDLGTLRLPAQPVRCRFPRLPVERPHPGLAWPGGPILTGADYDVRGDTAALYLHWCGPGDPLLVSTGAVTATVGALGAARCQTVRLPSSPEAPPHLTLRRLDGTPTRLLSLPLPAPRPDDRYLPYGDALVLTGLRLRTTADRLLVTLRWRATRPLADDYAISVRLLAADGHWLAVHDYQPALSTLPTLKWVRRGATIRDPHPFPGADPASIDRIAVAVYERFRLTPLPSLNGDVSEAPPPEP